MTAIVGIVPRARGRTLPDCDFPAAIFRDSNFFELFSSPPWESREIEHKHKCNDGGRPPTPWVRVRISRPGIVGILTLQATRN